VSEDTAERSNISPITNPNPIFLDDPQALSQMLGSEESHKSGDNAHYVRLVLAPQPHDNQTSIVSGGVLLYVGKVSVEGDKSPILHLAHANQPNIRGTPEVLVLDMGRVMPRQHQQMGSVRRQVLVDLEAHWCG
jgi:hypothetical protein